MLWNPNKCRKWKDRERERKWRIRSEGVEAKREESTNGDKARRVMERVEIGARVGGGGWVYGRERRKVRVLSDGKRQE